MNRNVCKLVLAVILIFIAGYGVYKNQFEKEPLSDIMIANVEALAFDESEGFDPDVFEGHKLIDCMDGDRRVGQTCERSYPEDQCNRKHAWGECK